jgi:hypothetical protein
MRRLLLGLLPTLTLLGCPGPSKSDAGIFDAGPDALTVELAGRFVQSDGAVLVAPADLRSRTMTLFFEGDGGFDVVSVLGNADGTFVVPDVHGRYLAQLGDLFISATSKHLSLAENIAGRAEVFVANPNEGLQLTASNLAPWTADDELQLASWGAGLTYFSTAQRHGVIKQNAPDAGDTSLTATLIDLEGEHVIEASKGDDLRVLQLSAFTLDGGGRWKSATRAAQLSVDLRLNAPTPVATTFDALRQQPISVRYDATSFEAAAAAVHPEAVPFETRWLLDAHLGQFGPDTITSGAPDLAVVQLPPDAGQVDLALTYGNPFPQAWTPFVTVGVAFDVPFQAPLPDGGLSPARSEVGSLTAVVSLAQSQGGPVDAPLWPVADVRLDGVLIGAGFPSVQWTPELSWQAPARGTISRVDVDSVELQAGSTTRRVQGPSLKVVGDVHRLRLPPGFLTPGATTYLRVTAVMQPATWNVEAPLRDVGPPAASATTLTQAFTVRPLP